MKILCLYNNECAIELFRWMEKEGHETYLSAARLDVNWCKEKRFDLAVSYTYRHIITEDALDAFHHNVVNLHNSYLPWNRGADPNIWSVIDDTPRGVSLHYVNSKLDKGDIIAQKLTVMEAGETLRSSYVKLDKEAKSLFKEAFRYYKYWPQMRKKAMGKGSYHSLADAADIKECIDTYDISFEEFRKRANDIIQKNVKGD